MDEAFEQEMREAQRRFYNNLLYLCQTHQISLRGLTSRLGIATSPVTKWKNGAWPDTKTLKKIADFFDITLDELLGNGEARANSMLLGSEEKRLILAYRRMSEEDRNILKIIVSKYEN